MTANDLAARSSHRGVNFAWRLRRLILVSTDRKADDLFRQHRRILQTSDRWLELPEKVQQQSAATAPAEISFRVTVYEPFTCASDLHRPDASRW